MSLHARNASIERVVHDWSGWVIEDMDIGALESLQRMLPDIMIDIIEKQYGATITPSAF